MVGKEKPADPVDQEMSENVSGEEDEAPEDDFFEADASAELTEDEDNATVEYESGDDEVSSAMGTAT